MVTHSGGATDFFTDPDLAGGVVKFVFIIGLYKHPEWTMQICGWEDCSVRRIGIME